MIIVFETIIINLENVLDCVPHAFNSMMKLEHA